MEVVLQLPKDMNKLCRTCMNLLEDNTTNFIILDNEQTELCKMLRTVTPLKLTVGDGLPQKICDICVYQLQTTYSFVNQCTDVEDTLKKILRDGEYSTVDTVSLNKSGDGLKCQICAAAFASHYELSMHMITHNINKTLVDRLRENYGDDKNICVDLTDDSFMKCKSLVDECRNNLPSIPYTSMKNKDKSISKFVLPKLEISENPDNFDCKTEHLCETCNLSFKTEDELSLHIPKCYKNTANNRKLVCSLCNKNFQDFSSLSLHFLNHSLAVEVTGGSNIIPEQFFCELCGQNFETDLLLSAHYGEVPDHKLSWNCLVCLEVFDKEKDQLIHNVRVHFDQDFYETKYEDEFECVLCSEKFDTKAEIYNHSLTHLMKRYKCRKCLLRFCTQDSYYAHLEVHSGKKHVCSVCRKYLSSNSALKSHIEGVHSVELQHCCSVCGKRFATIARLKTHSKIHTADKKYICSYCGYSSHKSGDLVMHTRIHTRERPYKCTFPNCTMGFKTSSHLCHHLRRHFKIKKFNCNLCSMNFSTNHGLKIHHMLHTGERPHSCIICKRTFRRKYHLKVHMKQHNDVVGVKN